MAWPISMISTPRSHLFITYPSLQLLLHTFSDLLPPQGQTIKYTAAWAPQPEWMRAPPIVMPASRTLPIHVQGGLECHEPPTCCPCAVAEVDGDTPPPCSPGQDAFQRAGSGEKAFCLVWPGFMEMQLPWTLLSSRLFHFQLIPIIPLAFYLKKVYILPSHIIYARQHTVSLENNIQTSRTVVSDEAGDGRSQFQRTGLPDPRHIKLNKRPNCIRSNFRIASDR